MTFESTRFLDSRLRGNDSMDIYFCRSNKCGFKEKLSSPPPAFARTGFAGMMCSAMINEITHVFPEMRER